jgi:mannose/fructose/N-acetylgalactosamine-specific phosphotransferase system component IIC
LVARVAKLETILAHLTSPSDDELLYVAKQAGVHAAVDAIGTPLGVAITNLVDLRRFVNVFVPQQCLHQIQEQKP